MVWSSSLVLHEQHTDIMYHSARIFNSNPRIQPRGFRGELHPDSADGVLLLGLAHFSEYPKQKGGALCIYSLRRVLIATSQLIAHDLVDLDTVDLTRDEYVDKEVDDLDNDLREQRLKGRRGWLWRVFYLVA